jgi:hypothetical protein
MLPGSRRGSFAFPPRPVEPVGWPARSSSITHTASSAPLRQCSLVGRWRPAAITLPGAGAGTGLTGDGRKGLGPADNHDRSDFHPDGSDTRLLLETWRSELTGEHGSLNDKQIGVSAS